MLAKKNRNTDGQNGTVKNAQFFAFVRILSVSIVNLCDFMCSWLCYCIFHIMQLGPAIALLCYVLTSKSVLALQISSLVLVFGSFVVVLCCSAIPFATPKCIQLLAVKRHCGCCRRRRRDHHHHNHCYFCRIVQDPIVLVLQLFLTILCVL